MTRMEPPPFSLLLVALAPIAPYVSMFGHDLVLDDPPLTAYVDSLAREGGGACGERGFQGPPDGPARLLPPRRPRKRLGRRLNGDILVTKDGNILRNYPPARWA